MSQRKKIKRKLEFGFFRVVIGLARLLPRKVGLAVFGWLGSLAPRVVPKDRERAVRNLGIAFPVADRRVREAWTRAMFRTLGRNMYDALTISAEPPEKIAARVRKVEGLEHLVAAQARGRGIIAITGHIGCWELLPAYFITQGYKVSVVARKMKSARVDEMLIQMRAAVGVISLDRDTSPRGMIAPLRRGEALGVLIDQHTSVAGMYVPFFGKPALTPTAIAKMAMMTGAPILPMAIFLEDDGRHVIHVLPVVEVPETGDRESRIERTTVACSQAIENLIRIDPKQWVWFHERWREPEVGDVVVAA